ncbi:MAG: PAS domain S-box protein, partial [Bacteroidetes bacterium]|nr:PAS domain S-box protein [Bacteroidota bacterium]
AIPSRKPHQDIVWNGTFIDVTDSQEANLAIAMSEEKHRSIVENSPDVILQIDRSGYIQTINHLQGDRKDGIIGRNIFHYISKKEAAKISKAVEIVFDKAKPQIKETIFDSKEGLKYFLVRIGPIFENNTVKAATLIVTDITELKLVQGKIREKSKKYENLLSNLPDIVARFDKSLSYTFINKAVERLTNFRNHDIVGKPINETGFLRGQQAFVAEKLSEVFVSGKKLTCEISYTTSIGNYHFLSSFVPEKNTKGEVITVLVIFRDIAKIKEVEEFLINKNKELEKLNLELDRFVYSASHDLRSPLSSILGLLNLAKGETDMAELEIFHQMIEESIHKLDDVVKEIIDYSKNSRTNVEPEEIKFEKLINETINFFKYSPEASKITFEATVDKDFCVVTDVKRLTMVLNNLISNSVKYSSSSRSSPVIKIMATMVDGKACIIIEDNGIGIEQEHLPHVFEMFYRATEVSKGTGLGLYIVKEIIEKIKGTISMESQIMVGSRITIMLPSLIKL